MTASIPILLHPHRLKDGARIARELQARGYTIHMLDLPGGVQVPECRLHTPPATNIRHMPRWPGARLGEGE